MIEALLFAAVMGTTINCVIHFVLVVIGAAQTTGPVEIEWSFYVPYVLMVIAWTAFLYI